MEIIYIILLLLSLLLAGVNINILLLLSQDLIDVIRGRLAFKVFSKRVALGLIICIGCIVIAVILTGNNGFLLAVSPFIMSPLLLCVVISLNLVGQRFKLDNNFNLIIEEVIKINRRKRF